MLEGLEADIDKQRSVGFECVRRRGAARYICSPWSIHAATSIHSQRGTFSPTGGMKPVPIALYACRAIFFISSYLFRLI